MLFASNLNSWLYHSTEVALCDLRLMYLTWKLDHQTRQLEKLEAKLATMK